MQDNRNEHLDECTNENHQLSVTIRELKGFRVLLTRILVLCQINAGAVLHSNTRKQALRLIKEGYVHVLSSDTHNMNKRPPRLLEAYELIEKELGEKTVLRLLDNADRLFHGKDIKRGKIDKKFNLF